MKRGTWTSLAACAALISVTLGGVALAAQGSQSDPLVTLSYLNEVVVPDILSQVDEKVDAKLSGQTGGFTAVSVAKGKKLVLDAGAQVLFRSGTASLSSAFLDVTDGGMVSAMKADHLYLATADAQSVTASSACTVLVQGGYSVK